VEGRVLVVDDHPLYRHALAELVASVVGAQHVETASSLEALALPSPAEEPPRLVLLDFRLPGKSGAEAVSLVRARYAAAPILVVSGTQDRREMAAAVRAGANGFISKTASMDELRVAVEAVLQGGALPVRLAGRPSTGDDDVLTALTPRQLEILSLLCEGHSNKEISLRLGVALVTVKTHLAAIFKVLGVVSRTQAVLVARRLGLG